MYIRETSDGEFSSRLESAAGDSVRLECRNGSKFSNLVKDAEMADSLVEISVLPRVDR